MKVEKNELAKCSSIGDWSEIAKSVIETCHGVLAVQDEDSNFPDKYIVSDQKHDYMVAGLQWKGAVIEAGGFLYVVDQRIRYDTGQDGKPFLRLQLDDNQQFGVIYAERSEDLPRYLKIDMTSGVVTPYKSYDQMLEADRVIFQKLKAEGGSDDFHSDSLANSGGDV